MRCRRHPRPFGTAIDAAVSGLMLNFTTDPAAVTAAMRHAVVPDGAVATHV